MKLSLTLTALALSTCLLRAEIERETLSTQGDWTISSCTDGGKPAGFEMLRTYDGKHEFHLRLHSGADGVYLDVTKDWSNLSEDKTQPVELRVNTGEGDPLWVGKGSVVTDADGLSWLRVPLAKSAQGDQTEAVLTAMMEGGKMLNVTVGKIAKGAEWEFDLKGGKKAYDAMYAALQKAGEGGEASGKPAGKDSGLVVHEYARSGDWGVHFSTNAQGEFVRGWMIRYCDNGSIIRMTLEGSQFHLDMSGDWKGPESSESKKGNSLPVYMVLTEQDDGHGLNEQAKIINEEGDKWLRVSQSLEEPSGMMDVAANGKVLNVIFSAEKKWVFNLKGSNAAWQKVQECVEKHLQD